MMPCSPEAQEDILRIDPYNHVKINKRPYFIHNEVESARFLFASSVSEIGPALRGVT